MTATIEERVAAGAAWLDQHLPNWLDIIDESDLDLGSTCLCVLGQLVNNVDRTADYFSVASSSGDGITKVPDPRVAARLGVTYRLSHQKAVRLGFHAGGDSWSEPSADGLVSRWKELTVAWRQLIETRRDAVS